MRIIPVRQSDAENLSPLLPDDVVDALKEGLPVTAFAAVREELAVGAISGVIDGDFFEIISIYVLPDYRRMGVGQALVERILELLEGEKLPIRAEYTLQDTDDEESSTLMPFFLDNGFYQEEDQLPCWYIGRLSGLHVRNPQLGDEAVMIKSFGEVSADILKAAAQEAQSNGGPVPEEGIISDQIDQKISSCVVAGGKVKAYLAVESVSDEFVKITALYSSYHDPRAMMAMIARTAEELNNSYKPDSRLAMLAASPISEKLIYQLFDKVVNCTKRFIRV